jgi:hypothetical protein
MKKQERRVVKLYKEGDEGSEDGIFEWKDDWFAYALSAGDTINMELLVRTDMAADEEIMDKAVTAFYDEMLQRKPFEGKITVPKTKGICTSIDPEKKRGLILINVCERRDWVRYFELELDDEVIRLIYIYDDKLYSDDVLHAAFRRFVEVYTQGRGINMT